ncbi:hypothetical protein HCH54_005239 [Aspergillus fumigatus]
MAQKPTTPIPVIAVAVGAFALGMLAVIGIFLQFRRSAARASVSTDSKEKKHHSDTEMLQVLEILCPTESYNDWVEHTQIEQDLSDRASAHFTWAQI